MDSFSAHEKESIGIFYIILAIFLGGGQIFEIRNRGTRTHMENLLVQIESPASKMHISAIKIKGVTFSMVGKFNQNRVPKLLSRNDSHMILYYGLLESNS